MDFDAISATIQDSFELEIIHPVTGEGGWFIELASPCNTAAQTKVKAILDRDRKRRFSTPSQDERDGFELITARILGWKGLKKGEDDVSFTPEAALAIVSHPKAYWLRTLLMEALGDPTRPFTI